MPLLALERPPFERVWNAEDFAETLPLVGGFAPVRDRHRRWGLVDEGGEIVVAPRFAGARMFHDGRFGVAEDRTHWGFCDSRGDVVIPCRYDEVDVVSEGLAAVRTGRTWAFVDEGGAEVAGGFAAALPFSEGLAPVQVAKLWGYIDRRGELAIEPRFARAFCFHGGRAQVVTGGRAARSPHLREHAKAPLRELRGQWGTIDVRGAYVIEPRFDYAESQFGDLATVPQGTRLRIEGCGRFSEGLVAVRVDGLWGYADASGALVIAPQYGWAHPFENGTAKVWQFHDERRAGAPGAVSVVTAPRAP